MNGCQIFTGLVFFFSPELERFQDKIVSYFIIIYIIWFPERAFAMCRLREGDA